MRDPALRSSLEGACSDQHPVSRTSGVPRVQSARLQWPFELEGRVGRGVSGRPGRRCQRRAARRATPPPAMSVAPSGLGDGPWCCSSGDHGEWIARAQALANAPRQPPTPWARSSPSHQRPPSATFRAPQATQRAECTSSTDRVLQTVSYRPCPTDRVLQTVSYRPCPTELAGAYGRRPGAILQQCLSPPPRVGWVCVALSRDESMERGYQLRGRGRI